MYNSSQCCSFTYLNDSSYPNGFLADGFKRDLDNQRSAMSVLSQDTFSAIVHILEASVILVSVPNTYAIHCTLRMKQPANLKTIYTSIFPLFFLFVLLNLVIGVKRLSFGGVWFAHSSFPWTEKHAGNRKIIRALF